MQEIKYLLNEGYQMENVAIQTYLAQKNVIDNEQAKKLLEQIIKDEHRHAKIIYDLMKELYDEEPEPFKGMEVSFENHSTEKLIKMMKEDAKFEDSIEKKYLDYVKGKDFPEEVADKLQILAEESHGHEYLFQQMALELRNL